MNPEIKKRWLEALRSRKYKQGHGALKTKVDNKNEHCCLGVLCEVYIEDHPEVSWEGCDAVNQAILGSTGVLPHSVVGWAELAGPDPTVGDVDLTSWNDHKGKKFWQIARKIEKYL